MSPWHSMLRAMRGLLFSGLSALALVTSAQEKPIVLVSIPPQIWLVRELVGDRVDVHCLLPVGANPHTYEPDIRQLRTLSKARLALPIGLPFDRLFLQKAKHLNPALLSIPVDTNIAKIAEDDAHHHEHGEACSENGYDPHIWLSPRRFAGIATNTACALATLMPSQASDLSNRLMRVTQTIHAVEQQAQKKLAPFAGMLWVVYHPSWRYFASDYNLHILTVELDGKSPSSRHIITIVKQARAAHVKAVFTEPQYDKRYAHAVADPLNARVEVIDPLQEDWPLLMQTLLEKLTQ